MSLPSHLQICLATRPEHIWIVAPQHENALVAKAQEVQLQVRFLDQRPFLPGHRLGFSGPPCGLSPFHIDVRHQLRVRASWPAARDAFRVGVLTGMCLNAVLALHPEPRRRLDHRAVARALAENRGPYRSPHDRERRRAYGPGPAGNRPIAARIVLRPQSLVHCRVTPVNEESYTLRRSACSSAPSPSAGRTQRISGTCCHSQRARRAP